MNIFALMYAIIDVETTGGSPAYDRLIEIAIFVYDGVKVIDSYTTLVNPHRPIDPYVTKLTGITQEMVETAPSFEDIHAKILDLTHENIFVAHNVKFDFGMIRQEYKRMGIDFNRKLLDTVNLSRKALPGFDSYSLGNICQSLNIVISDRHRAYGDAEATVKLLEIILANPNAAKYLEIELNQGIDADLLPAFLSKAEIEKLPEDAGVFYYRDETGKVLYLDGTKNIKRKVITEFSKNDNSLEKKRLNDCIRSIDYELSGNELIAKLRAYRETQRHQPEFNKKPRVLPFTHAIFIEDDEQGFKSLKVHKIDWPQGEPVLKFTAKAPANKVLTKIIQDNHLHAQFTLKNKLKEQPELDTKALQAYNDRIEKSVRKYLYRHHNFFLIGEGIHPDEHSVVWVENNEYKGIGYFNPEITQATPENLKEVIRHDEDDPETQKILRSYLRKLKNSKIIAY